MPSKPCLLTALLTGLLLLDFALVDQARAQVPGARRDDQRRGSSGLFPSIRKRLRSQGRNDGTISRKDYDAQTRQSGDSEQKFVYTREEYRELSEARASRTGMTGGRRRLTFASVITGTGRVAANVIRRTSDGLVKVTRGVSRALAAPFRSARTRRR